MRLFYLLLLFVFLPTGQEAHADCTLAGSAICDGSPCPGKIFKAGQIIFNNDHGLLQVCLNDDTWKALHRPPDPCTLSVTPGTACLDGGIVYAGTWMGNRYYTTTADQSVSAVWKTSFGIDDIPTDSIVDGLANSNQVPNNSDFPAFKLCKDLGIGWYLPAMEELKNVLLTNRVATGGFSNDWYWSSTEATTT